MCATTVQYGSCYQTATPGDLWLPHLSATLTTHIFPDEILGNSLIRIFELCNNGCVATFTSNAVHVTNAGFTVLHQEKDPADSLWTVSLPNLTAIATATAASAILRSDTDEKFATFIHKSFGSPVLSTFLRTVRKGYLSSYPRLTAPMITSYLSLTAATARGHLDHHRRGIDSTSLDDSAEDLDIATPALPRGTAFTQTLSLSHTAHSDLAGTNWIGICIHFCS